MLWFMGSRQYFGHLMGRADSLEETLMMGKIEGRRRRTHGPKLRSDQCQLHTLLLKFELGPLRSHSALDLKVKQPAFFLNS